MVPNTSTKFPVLPQPMKKIDLTYRDPERDRRRPLAPPRGLYLLRPAPGERDLNKKVSI